MPTHGVARTAWQGTAQVTRERYIPQVVETLVRGRLLTAMLRKRGRFKMNETGDQLTWPVEYKQTQPRQLGDGQPLVFTRKDHHKQAGIDFRSYYAEDLITHINERQNRGPEAMVKLIGTKLESLKRSMGDFWNSQLYVDGYASGNEQKMHGFESFAGTSTTTTADKIAKPGDTYAGVSTAVGAAGGSWSSDLSTSPNASIASDWPFGGGANGQLDSHYDYWSPKLWNWSSTAWGTGGTTWRDNCLSVLRTAIEVQQRLCGSEGRPDLFLTESQMAIDIKDKLETRLRIQSPHKESMDLGFASTINYDGLGIDTDYSCPVNSGYGLSLNNLSICSQHDELFKSWGPEWQTDRLAYIFLCIFLGNAKYTSPKFFFEAKNYA
jgi:hypothetical protein